MKPLAPNDAIFLWLEHREQPMHVAGLQIYHVPDGAGPDFVHDLLAKFREQVKATQPFNQRPVSRLGAWFWEEDTEFELDYHLRHSALPRPGRIRELLALVSRLHSTPMDRSRPLWELHVIEGLADGRIAVYVKVHHAMFDGVAASKLLQRALCETPDARKPALWALDPEPEKPGVAAVAHTAGEIVQEVLHAGREILPGLRSGIWELIRPTDPDPSDAAPFHAPPTIFNVPISGSRRFAAQSYSLERLKAVGRKAGGTVNDVSLAICSGALRQYLKTQSALPELPLIAMVPVSVRGPDDNGGNQVAVMLANLETHLEDPVQRMELIIRSTTHAKEKLARMTRLERVAHAAALLSPMLVSNVTGQARRHPIFNVVVSNVPGPRCKLYMNGLELDEMYPVSIPFDYLALNITISGFCDQLGFGYTACRRSVPQLQRMLDYTEQALVDLEKGLGL